MSGMDLRLKNELIMRGEKKMHSKTRKTLDEIKKNLIKEDMCFLAPAFFKASTGVENPESVGEKSPAVSLR